MTKIVEELRRRKILTLEPELKALKAKRPLPTLDLFKKLEAEKKEVKIQTGTLLDDLIGGGLPPKTSMLLYGEYGAGKSQTCYTMCTECPHAVELIDAENSFRAERLKQLCDERGKNWEEVFKKTIVKQPQNWVQQMRVLYSLPPPSDVPTGKVGLIILDSLTKRFRGVEFSGRQSLWVKQPLIREFSFRLEEIIKAYEAGLIITTQVYEDPNATSFLAEWTKFKAVGGSSLLHQPDFVIFLRRAKGKNIRIARMMDSSWQPLRECPFVITGRGIDNLPEDAKARKALLEKAARFEANQKQEAIKAKQKKGEKKSKSEEAPQTEEMTKETPQGEE